MTDYFYGPTTVAAYIEMHPGTLLAKRLAEKGWADDQKIEVVKGWEVTELKTTNGKRGRGGNLYQALQRSKSKEYVKGGKLGNSDGWVFAVKL